MSYTEHIVDVHFRDRTEFHLGDRTGRVSFNTGGDYWIGRVDGVWLLNSSSRLIAEKEVCTELTRQVEAAKQPKPVPVQKMWAVRYVNTDHVVAWCPRPNAAWALVNILNDANILTKVYVADKPEEVK